MTGAVRKGAASTVYNGLAVRKFVLKTRQQVMSAVIQMMAIEM